jgi:hypothetical protein
MGVRRIGRSIAGVLAPAALMLSLQSGCDDSRTSGTHVEISPEAKAQIQDMREMYKDMDKGSARKATNPRRRR